jgi:hypothetical protein
VQGRFTGIFSGLRHRIKVRNLFAVPFFSLAITFVSLYNVNYHPMKNFIMDQAMKGQSLCSSHREPAAVKTGGNFAES